MTHRAPDAAQVAQRLDAAREFARRAGEITLRYFGDSALEVTRKGDDTPVTRADREAERELRRLIGADFPGDAIVGEEFDEAPGDSDFRWILDPIDGTKSFVRAVPLYGTLIGVEHVHTGQVVAGVVHMPALDESVWASLGQGAMHKPQTGGVRPARVSETPSLEASLLCITWLATHADRFDDVPITRLLPRIGAVRGWSDCYAHVLVATGRADLVVEPVVSVWDVAPLGVIIPEAGGRLTDLRGQDDIRSGTALSSNGRVHEAALRAIRGE